ncbi:MAG: sugar phosphate isomerase/epimerase family protein [Candidatus Zipacnadales bacterium]
MAKIAVGSWAYMFGPYESNPVPLDEVLAKLQELKFEGVELAGFTPHAHPDDYPTASDRATLKQKIVDHGLEIAGFAANLYDNPPASSDPVVRQGYLDTFKKNVEFCVAIGSPSIRVDTVSPPPLIEGESYDSAWANLVSIWRECADFASGAGLFIVWEFEPGFMLNKPSEVLKLHQDIGRQNFTILFDTCHAHMCSVVAARQPEPKETLAGGAVEFAQMLAGRIGHIHLIDSDETLHDDETSTHAPFGTGVLDFDTLLPAILKAGYESEWWGIDLCFWPEAWEVTEHSKQFVEALREKYG